MKKWLFPLVGAFLLCISCATKAPPPEEPQARLSLGFDHIEALSPEDITLFFAVEGENPRSSALDISLGEWELFLNGAKVEKGIAVSLDKGTLEALSSGTVPLSIHLGGEALALPDKSGFIEYNAGITLSLILHYQGGESLREQVSTEIDFPRIQIPEFTISSMAVVQAELINTRFKVRLRIDNPNNFPLELSSFAYELYGAGRYWAEGKETKVMPIPPQGSAERDLYLLMNFINMKREVLDQVIAMRNVRYRFTGDVLVGTGIEYLPRFTMSFDRSGDSPVIQ
ncbi:LEA type 2 family protein [Treponema primitia]|nr:LEA type 2 family protein [Treponema primitia]